MKLYKYKFDSSKDDSKVEMECISCKKIYKGYSSDKYEYILPKRNYNKYEWEIGIDEINNTVFAGKEYIDYNYLTYYSDSEINVNIVYEIFTDYIQKIIQSEEDRFKEKMNNLMNVKDKINKVK